MNLIVLTAFVAVCGAAKLDRSYLPPASAKTAGGSPGSIQAPFSRSSFNNGLGGLPKGSYENEFQGIVVDAAAAGTRAAETAESGLGAPRISYGSSDSKVGAAAFKTRPYNQPQGAEATSGNSQFEQSQGFQQGNTQQFSSSQSQPGASSQGFQSSQPERPRAALDRNAGILRFENEVGPENYHFAYETDNGITAEENGVATNGVQAQGGFSYTGDDGQVYSVSYTADEKGYQPKGAHLPTPPPIPVEILKSLEQNARDEAAGLKDDGSYDAQKYNAGNDYTESDGANGKFTHQSTKFSGTETDATASSTFIDQSKQPFGRPGQFDKQSSSANFGTSNRFSEQNSFKMESNVGSAGQNQVQGQNSYNGQFLQANTGSFNRGSIQPGASSSSANGFGSLSGNNGINQGNRAGNRNEYLPPLSRPNQNGRPQNGRPLNGKSQTGRPQAQSNLAGSTLLAVEDTKTDEPLNFVPLGQQDLQSESRPQGAFTSFGKPLKMQNGFSSFNQNKLNNGRKPNGNFAQTQSQSGNGFTRPNEYLPPGRKPADQRPQFNGMTNTEQQYSQQYQSSASFKPSEDKPQETSFDPTSIKSQSLFNIQSPSTFSNEAQTSFISQNPPTNTFQRPQSSRPSQNVNRFSSQNQAQFGSSTSQAAPSFGFTQSIKTTSQPDTELTTPFESGNDDSFSSRPGQSSLGFNSRPTSRPGSFGSQVNSDFTSQSNQATTVLGQSASFPTQSSFDQYNQNSQFGIQAQTSVGQNNDAQFASSTQRPSYYQQTQGADDSYYYNPPSRPFGSTQGSRFPGSPSNQFNKGNQQSAFTQDQSFNSIQESPRRPFETSNKYPRPPTVTPPTSTVEGQNLFQGSQIKQQFQGSTKYPRPPTIAPPSSSLSTQYQGNTGIIQSASTFQSQSPTSSAQGQSNTKPSFQSQLSQTQSSSFESETFDKQSQEQESTNEQTEKPVAFQQYNGEIYEYNKPAQTLPPPDSTPVTATGTFAQKVQSHQSNTQFGQTNDEDDQRPSQFGLQSQGLRPQAGAQNRPQISTTQTQINAQYKPDSKPYGALAQSQNVFGQNSQTTRPQNPQFGQDTFGTQSQTDEKLDSRFEQPSEENSKNKFGFEAACCGQGPMQFGQNFSGSQNFRPEPTNFAATAEDFSGPRQPPSFDEQTGYHY